MKGCRPLTEIETSEVAKSFGGQYGARDRLLFELGMHTGFRISELLSIRIRDVIQNGKVVDRVTVARRNMKKKIESRTVILHPAVKPFVLKWLKTLGQEETLPGDTFLFRSRVGANNPIDRRHAWRILKEAYAANELTGKLGTHTLRKSFANSIYERLGRDLVRTARAMGHRNVSSTVSYLSFREEDIDEAILSI